MNHGHKNYDALNIRCCATAGKSRIVPSIQRTLAIAMLSAITMVSNVVAQGTAFTYQGSLSDGATPADGGYDLNFSVWESSAAGIQIGGSITKLNVPVSDGLFTVTLDFGVGFFTGPDRWLEINVQTNGGGGYTTLSPRTEFTSTPYAIQAITASGVPSGAIGSSEVANNSLTSLDLGPNSVGTSEVIDNNLTANDLAPGSVASSEVLNNSLTANDLAPGSVASSEVLNDSLTASDLAPNSVGASEIAAGAVGSSEVANGSLLGADLANNTVGSAQIADSLSLGSSGVDGFLYLYSSSPGGYSINLTGGDTYGGRMWLYSNDGQNGVWMAGGSGDAGIIQLYNTNGGSSVVLDGYGTGGGGSATFDAEDGTATIHIWGEGTGSGGEINLDEDDGTTAVELQASNGGHLYLNDGSGQSAVRLSGSTSSGGIGYIYRADGGNGIILDGDSAGDAYMRLYNAENVGTVYIDGGNSANEGYIALYSSNGAARITLDADVGGDGRITCDELQINGGSDLSEQFDIQNAAQPGSVVCIDPANPGKLVTSSKAYDRTVAGIVSGAGGVKPGMMMGQKGTVADGEYPVALSGRVYCMVDASEGAIQPGDLITTSEVPGHGMKVADYDRAHGAIIGKAMTGLDEGQGLVLVLVSLH